MKNRPVHENLDTSFVNLSALIKYLRRRQFAGIVRVKLNNYEAEIHITDENQMKVREQDHLSGRVSEGEEALQRILIRSREPGGTVNVFQKVTGDPPPEIPRIEAEKKPARMQKKISVAEIKSAQPAAVVPEKISAPKIEKEIKIPTPPTVQSAPVENFKTGRQMPETKVSLPDFPFRLSNNVEAKAQQTKISNEQFQTLVRLFSEILGTIDRTLSAAKLNFAAAFSKVCAEISFDYPFLKPEENIFQYQNGALKISGQINQNQFAASQLEAVRRVIEKLGANPKFSETYRTVIQNLLALLRRQKPLCDEFQITAKLEKILGA